jgi:transcriptional regulator with XRE-family HTH domain
MTQTELGGYLPVTFQQIQKYERGVNSVSAASLSRLAVALSCGLNEFFEAK